MPWSAFRHCGLLDVGSDSSVFPGEVVTATGVVEVVGVVRVAVLTAVVGILGVAVLMAVAGVAGVAMLATVVEASPIIGKEA